MPRSGRLGELLVLVASVTVVAACASGGGAGILSQSYLTEEELVQADYETVYDLLRAHARARIISDGGQEYLTVYDRGGIRGSDEASLIVDDREVRGDVMQVLRGMPLSIVRSLRILRPSETSARYGGDGRVGAVVIETRESSGG